MTNLGRFISKNLSRLLSLMLSLMLFTSAFAADLDLNPKGVAQLLHAFHNIEWANYIQQDADKVAARKSLLAIYQHPEKIKLPGEGKLELAILSRRALIEFGRFAQNPDGSLSSEATKLYKELPKVIENLAPADQEMATIAYLQSLTNSGTPEAANTVMKYISSPDPSMSIVATQLVEEMLKSEAPPVDLKIDSGVEYSPNLYTPLEQRSRPEEWRKVVSNLATVFSDTLESKTKSKELTKTIRKTQEIAIRFVSSDAPKLDQNKNGKSMAESDPSPGLALQNQDSSSSTVNFSSGLMLLFAGLFVALLLGFYFFKKHK